MIAGLTHLVAPTFASGFYPGWYFALSAVGYGLILPAIASLHVRHVLIRQSGAVLGTITGVGVVIFGYAAAAVLAFTPAVLFVAGMWWWTIGKMWAQRGVMPRAFGWLTMALAVACFALFGAFASTGGALMAVPDLPLRLILGAWLIVLAGFFWRDAR
ncbi:MAG: hypothetical protein ACRDG6_07295 [Candidatus Limnocylindria bacterium]